MSAQGYTPDPHSAVDILAASAERLRKERDDALHDVAEMQDALLEARKFLERIELCTDEPETRATARCALKRTEVPAPKVIQ